MTSDASDSSFGGRPLLDPLDDRWYVRADAETVGPYDGRRVREMIERGRLGLDTPIARVGATEWSFVRDVPAFASLIAASDTNVATDTTFHLPGSGFDEPTPPIRYAGFWIRLLAYLIDAVILDVVILLLGGIIGIVGFGVAERNGTTPPMESLKVIGGLAGLFASAAYYVMFTSGAWQATPGKRLLGIHVITIGGERVSGSLAFGRWLAYILSTLPLWIGFLMIGWTEEKKGLHDMICGTRVVYGEL